MKTYGHHDYRGEDEGHQCHAAHGIAAHNCDGIGGNGGEQEGDDAYQDDGDECLQDVAAEDTEIEEEAGDDDHGHRTEDNDLHWQVALCARYVGLCVVAFLAQFLAGESYGALDHAPAVDDADDTGHGDASDTDRAGIVEEDVLR